MSLIRLKHLKNGLAEAKKYAEGLFLAAAEAIEELDSKIGGGVSVHDEVLLFEGGTSASITEETLIL